MVTYVNLSDKIGKYSKYVLTPDHKLVLFYPTNRLFDIKDIKPDWFRCRFPGGYVGMHTYLSLHDASSVTISSGKRADCIMVFTLDLRGVCRAAGVTVEEFADALVLRRRRLFMTVEQKEGLDAALCVLFDYDIVPLLEHKETFYNHDRSPDRKSKLWRELTSCCRVIFSSK